MAGDPAAFGLFLLSACLGLDQPPLDHEKPDAPDDYEPPDVYRAFLVAGPAAPGTDSHKSAPEWDIPGGWREFSTN